VSGVLRLVLRTQPRSIKAVRGAASHHYPRDFPLFLSAAALYSPSHSKWL